MNDALRTDVFLRYSAENIACACIYLSARELQIPLPTSPPWFLIFGADEESIRAICVRILHLYTHPVRSQDELEKLVQKCRENIDAERQLRAQLLIKNAVDAAKEAAALHLASKRSESALSTTPDKDHKPIHTLHSVVCLDNMFSFFFFIIFSRKVYFCTLFNNRIFIIKKVKELIVYY